MGEGTHDGDEELAFGVEGPDAFFFEEDLHAFVFEGSNGGERVDGVAGEPGHTLGDDQVDLAVERVGDHLLESSAVFG